MNYLDCIVPVYKDSQIATNYVKRGKSLPEAFFINWTSKQTSGYLRQRESTIIWNSMIASNN